MYQVRFLGEKERSECASAGRNLLDVDSSAHQALNELFMNKAPLSGARLLRPFHKQQDAKQKRITTCKPMICKANSKHAGWHGACLFHVKQFSRKFL